MKGKTVFITGAAGGLGASTTRHLAERNWHVFAADFDEQALRVVGKERGVVGLVEIIHAALTARHPRAAYSVKSDLQRIVLDMLPARAADLLPKLALGRAP